MNIHDLEAFIAVVETGSIGAAAVRLNLTQPGVTRRVQSLEQTLGTPLLDRRSKPPTITAAGRAAYDHARRVSLALRPEKVSIIKAQAGGGFENRFAGTVREMLYMGDVTVYRVQTGSGGVVEALLANSASGLTPFFQIGDAVEVGWSAAAGHVLAD
jgi:ABC-type Fe3+/spermidine/putrescine transport system ATPase subunit